MWSPMIFFDWPPEKGSHNVTKWMPLSPGVPCTRFALPAARKLSLSMSEFGEKERNYLFKSHIDLRVMT